MVVNTNLSKWLNNSITGNTIAILRLWELQITYFCNIIYLYHVVYNYSLHIFCYITLARFSLLNLTL